MLIYVGAYLPGRKSGGPVGSIANLIENLGQCADFYVVTRDRDIDDTTCYPNIVPGRFCAVGKAQVIYCSSMGFRTLLRIYHEVQPDLIYLNSLHAKLTRKMLVLRRLGVLGTTPFLLAPRGELASGAMRVRAIKKHFYHRVARFFRLYEKLLWHVSTPIEGADVMHAAPVSEIRPESLFVAPNIPAMRSSSTLHPHKEPGSIRLVYISRISKNKNLGFLLDLLPQLNGQVELTVYGPVEKKDAAYWTKCQQKIARLPANIEVHYRGQAGHEAVATILQSHHFFVLPTWSENFCHSAVESFLSGTPVLISDATPWRSLNQEPAGFDIPLSDRATWTRVLQACVDMNETTYCAYLDGARRYGAQFSAEEAIRKNIAMFNTATGVVTGDCLLTSSEGNAFIEGA